MRHNEISFHQLLLAQHNLFSVLTCGAENDNQEMASDAYWHVAVTITKLEIRYQYWQTVYANADAKSSDLWGRYQRADDFYYGRLIYKPEYCGWSTQAVIRAYRHRMECRNAYVQQNAHCADVFNRWESVQRQLHQAYEIASIPQADRYTFNSV